MRENLPELLPEFPSHVIPKRKARTKYVEVAPPGPIALRLRAAEQYMRRHGFSHLYGTSDHGPACFLGAFAHACVERTKFCCDGEDVYDQVQDFFTDTIFDGASRHYGDVDLIRHGWTTLDAVAALQVAADYAHAIGK